jgi:hypothetical protein
MAKARDIKLEDNDLVIQNGDFVITDSDAQHVEDIIQAYVGHYKEFPLVGVGIDLYINSSGTQLELERLIRLQLEGDGYSVNNIIVENDGKITIDAERI